MMTDSEVVRPRTELVAEIRRQSLEIEALRSENAELLEQVAELQTTVSVQIELGENLKTQLAELRSKLAVTSRNSSKPPSSDPPDAPPRRSGKRGRKGGRKAGGQPGHEGTTRELVPVEQVDEVVECVPAVCEQCECALTGSDEEPRRHQVIDIPEPRLITTEYRLHELECSACGARTRGELPLGVPTSWFGVRLHAMTAMLVGCFRQSKRLVTELYDVVYGLSISPGSVCAMERRVSKALTVPVEEAREAIRRESVVGSDETSWRRMRRKAWLWVAATDQLAVFTIARRRGSKVVKRILGEAFAGVVTSDRWSAYSHLDRRQLCWAHLLRDFVGMMERFHSPWHGNRLRLCALEVMAAYADRQAGLISHDEMVRRLQPVREHTKRRLTWASKNAPGPTARAKAREILKLEPHLWTFLDDPAIPVTNNLCERLLRYAVIWRKLSYGTQSMDGTRFMERILTVCATLDLQDRDVFGYLTEAVEAYFSDQNAPSILPAAPS